MPATSPPPFAKPLLAASLALLAGGAVLAVAQPGDLGDDDEGAQSVDGPDSSSTTTAGVTVTTGAGQVGVTTSTTATTATTGTATTATTAAGSGLGSNGVSRADDATATTGIESMLGPGLLAAAAAVVLRRAGRTRQA
jgi:hypothetical protein